MGKHCACDTGYQWDSNKCAKCPRSPVGKCFDMTSKFDDKIWAATDKDKNVILSFTPDETIFNFAWTSEIRSYSGYSLRTCTTKCSRPIDYYTDENVHYLKKQSFSSCTSTCSDLTTTPVASIKNSILIRCILFTIKCNTIGMKTKKTTSTFMAGLKNHGMMKNMVGHYQASPVRRYPSRAA